jgi:hypothetical protein
MKLHLFLAFLIGGLTVGYSIASSAAPGLPDSPEMIARYTQHDLENLIRRNGRLFSPQQRKTEAPTTVRVRGVTALV